MFICRLSFPFSNTSLATHDPCMQMFSNYWITAFPSISPLFAKKNCDDLLRLQSLLAQSSKHITHACVCKSRGLHIHTYTESHNQVCLSFLSFSLQHTYTQFLTDKEKPTQWSKAYFHLLRRHWSGPPMNSFFILYIKSELFIGKLLLPFACPSEFISSVSLSHRTSLKVKFLFIGAPTASTGLIT